MELSNWRQLGAPRPTGPAGPPGRIWGNFWKSGRVAQGSGLENRQFERARGFESHLFRMEWFAHWQVSSSRKRVLIHVGCPFDSDPFRCVGEVGHWQAHSLGKRTIIERWSAGSTPVLSAAELLVSRLPSNGEQPLGHQLAQLWKVRPASVPGTRLLNEGPRNGSGGSTPSLSAVELLDLGFSF